MVVLFTQLRLEHATPLILAGLIATKIGEVMHRMLSAFAWAIIFSNAALAQDNDHGAAQLNGSWTVDLRPSNEAATYLKPMKLVITDAGEITGEFYDHSIQDGRSFNAKGRACFAFHTSDDSGPYQTSGCRVGDKIEGQTWSEGRRFMLTWTAIRATAN